MFKLKTKEIWIFPALLVVQSYTSEAVKPVDKFARPNIVLILMDDLGWKDVSYMGSEYYETPNIDRLAKNGMIFSQAYASAANCAPSRACLLSGQYTPRHGVYTVGVSDRGESKDRRLIPVKNSLSISLDKITIAEALKPAGYTCAAIGKWHVGNKPLQQGFDVGFDRQDLGYPEGHFRDDGEYLTDRLTDESVKFIRENNPAKTGKPFFLSLSHHAVHTPIQAKPEKIQKYKGKPGQGCHKDPVYAAMVESMDESVGKINKVLEEEGIANSTLVLFTSDNGGFGPKTCMKPLRGGKGMYYEGGIREPMFVYWPGHVKPGTSTDVPVVNTDFYPTLLELAGVEPSKDYTLDGKSFLSTLNGEKNLIHDKIFWHSPIYLESYNGLKNESRDTIFRTRPVSVIRKGDWKLLLFHEEWMLDGGRAKIQTNNSVELYNLANDIGESKNLCNSNPLKRDELLDDLLNWLASMQAPMARTINPEYKKQ